MRSVLEQGYRNVEYSVLDAGSTDRTIDILRRYDAQLSCWRSEKDGGQAAAIKKALTVRLAICFAG
jgi:glycosyltransferase involved in cell wall biosynthesis